MSSITDYLQRVQPPNFDQIAPKLRAGRHHVVWKAEQRGQKIGKIPFIARAYLDRGTYYQASSIKPRSWSTFPQAQKAYEHGNFAGVGRVLCNDITLVDIDHCIDPNTGAIHPVALEIMTELDTYTERSPGQDGLHIFPAGALPENAKNRYQYKGLEIELYSTGRYSTLTGHHIADTPADVQERQSHILTLIERLERWERENTLCVCVCGESSGEHPNQARDVAQQPLAETLPNIASADGAHFAETTVSAKQRPVIHERDLAQEDQLVLAKARAARNGATFQALWEGGDPQRRNDHSRADFDLILMLLYWTNDHAEQAERLFRASGRYRPEKTDRKATRSGQSYLQHTIENALQKRHTARRAPSRTHARPIQTAHVPEKPDPKPPTPSAARCTPARQDRRITHAHSWTRLQETAEQRQAKLQDAARHVTEQVEQHIRNGQRGLLVANVAPGVGKSSSVAPLGLPGVGLSLGWIAERRNMVNQVQALSSYRQIEPCTRHNCADGHSLHNALGERGYNAWSVHKRHGLHCQYAQQFTYSGSAVYQLAHVATRYPAQHDGIIIDELDITKWLPEREITIARLAAAARVYATDSTADLLLRCVAATLTDASQAKRQLHGLELFVALDQRSGGRLADWIAELAQDARYTNTHPWHELDEDDPAALEHEAASLAPVVLPHILVALLSELVKWQHGQPWNSCLRIGPGAHGYALSITERRSFSPSEQGLPARAILDATADAELLSRLFGEQIALEQADIEPPPGTRHIAVRTGKRYGKVSLTAKRKDSSPNRDLQRAIAEARYLLRELDPNGNATIGLISFKGCIDELGEALGIPEERRLHFWAARGSNALQECAILLVIGTPCVHPATIARLARALWADDPEPISEESKPDDQGIRRYVDPRMQRLSDYLTHAELTQCAHRSRALRQPRTVVTFCLGEIGYLPATETITELPQLLPDGRERWAASREAEHDKLNQARQALEEAGHTLAMLTVRELKAAAAVSTDAAADYLRQARHVAQQSLASTLPTTHTTPTCSHFVPDSPSSVRTDNLGTNPTRHAPPVLEPPQQQITEVFTPRRGTATTPPEYRRACGRCGGVDDWVRDPNGRCWVCACYYWWYEHPERRRPRQVFHPTG